MCRALGCGRKFAHALVLVWVVDMAAVVVLQRRGRSFRARIILEDFLEEGVFRADIDTKTRRPTPGGSNDVHDGTI